MTLMQREISTTFFQNNHYKSKIFFEIFLEKLKQGVVEKKEFDFGVKSISRAFFGFLRLSTVWCKTQNTSFLMDYCFTSGKLLF